MQKPIAITGATGFAGRHAVAELLKRGASLRALVRDPASARLPADVALVKGDLHSAEALDELLRDAGAVVHLAGAITALTRDDYFRVNAAGTQALAEASRRAGVPRFVHVSSLSAREPSLSSYGASKRAGEEEIGQRASELNAVIIRPPAVYGPGDKGTLPLIKELTRPVAAIPGQRHARFSLIHARDLARIIGQAVRGTETGIHEVGDGKAGGYSWEDLLSVAERHRGGRIRPIFLPRGVPAGVALAAETWAKLTGKPGMVNRGKIAELYHPDWVSREGTLALTDPTAFAEGFPDTVAWYREAGWLPKRAGADRSGPKQ